MASSRSEHGLTKACLSVGKYQPHDLLRWLVGDVLADFGVRSQEPPPQDILAWLRAMSAEYATCVAECPFEDVLGQVYQELASRGHRSALGQFFTPDPITSFMSSVLVCDDKLSGPRPGGGLWRMCEPGCGSGAIILGFIRSLRERHGLQSTVHWSVSAIDLDPLCAQMCAAQVLSNLMVHRGTLGELVVYRGNALGPASGLAPVVHATVRDVTPDIVLPAMHPSRLRALREAIQSVTSRANYPADGTPRRGAVASPQPRAVATSATTSTEADEVNLFGD